MADYKEFKQQLNRQLYHEGEWQWQEGEYTVTRSHQWSAPGCHNACGVLLYTKDNKLVKVEGDPLNPFNDGKLCMRCLNLVEAVNHPDRVKYPMKRVGERGENKWERISWDEAYDLITAKVREIHEKYGSETILGVHGTGRNINITMPFLFLAGLQTPNISTFGFTGFACYLPRVFGSAAIAGDFFMVDTSFQHPERYEAEEWRRPDIVMIWGNEPLASNADGFLGHWLVQCMQMGTKIISIDPRLTYWGVRSEVWLPIRPGTDAALALGFLNVIINEDLYDHDFVERWTTGFPELKERVQDYPPEKVAEICWLDAEAIKKAARLFANAQAAAIQWGLAMDQQISCMGLVLGLCCLVAITGNLDIPGGNVFVRHAWNTTHYETGGEYLRPGLLEKKLVHGDKEGNIVPHASSDAILRAMETGKPYPIKMIWLQSSNTLACPAMDAPRVYEAMKKVEFIVNADPFLTPTSVALADIILPVAMGPERNSKRSWWTPLRAINKACSYYEAKTDEEIAVEFARRLNPEIKMETDIDFLNWYFKANGDWQSGFEGLREVSWSYDNWGNVYRKYEKGLLREDGQPGFNTASGKVELSPMLYAAWGIDPLPYHVEPPESPISTPELYQDYPLILTTGGRSFEFFHSEHRQLKTMREFHPDPLVTMNPEVAQAHGITEGDWVWIEGTNGARFKQKAHLDVSLSPKFIHAEHGWWFPEREAAEPSLYGVFDSNPNNVTVAERTGQGGIGSPIKSMLCRIYKVDQSNSEISPTEQVVKLGGFSNGKQ